MMRILHCISSVNPAGGGPIEGVKQLAAVNRDRGHQIEVASLDAPAAPYLRDFPVPLHPLGPGRGSFAYAPRAIPWLRAHAADYDAVVVDGLWQHNSYAVWRALRGSSTPYFVYTHGMLDPWFKTAYPLKHLKKMLYWPWGMYPVLRDAAAVLFTCDEERRLAREPFRPYRCTEDVVGLGTMAPGGDPVSQREAFHAAYPGLRGKRILLFDGRLHPIKGCDLLVEALGRTAGLDPAAHLVIAGPDQQGLQAGLQSRALALGVAERITWTGMVRGDVKWGAYYAADAFVLPSHHENFGVVIAEALSCGLPVLISDRVQICRDVEQDGAGLVGDDTADGAERLLRQWLAMPEPDRAAMRQRARSCFDERYEIHRAADSLIQALHAGGARG